MSTNHKPFVVVSNWTEVFEEDCGWSTVENFATAEEAHARAREIVGADVVPSEFASGTLYGWNGSGAATCIVTYEPRLAAPINYDEVPF
jgi:hypothetical protein